MSRARRFRLGRRAFLRGAASTVIGLPLLECMLNDSGTAFADGSALPCRFFLFFSPTSLGHLPKRRTLAGSDDSGKRGVPLRLALLARPALTTRRSERS